MRCSHRAQRSDTWWLAGGGAQQLRIRRQPRAAPMSTLFLYITTPTNVLCRHDVVKDWMQIRRLPKWKMSLTLMSSTVLQMRSQLTFTWRYFAFRIDRIEESSVDTFYNHMMHIKCLQCFVFLFISQVWAESSNNAQVFFTAGLHGHHPALTRSDQVFLMSLQSQHWCITFTFLTFKSLSLFYIVISICLYYNYL